MRLSLIIGLAMLIGKTTAYFMTHSAAIFSDAAESVFHVIAVGFASFSLRLSTKPASQQFVYGYERITFFSAGFEGDMITKTCIDAQPKRARDGARGLWRRGITPNRRCNARKSVGANCSALRWNADSDHRGCPRPLTGVKCLNAA
jgi:Cation efflux family